MGPSNAAGVVAHSGGTTVDEAAVPWTGSADGCFLREFRSDLVDLESEDSTDFADSRKGLDLMAQ